MSELDQIISITLTRESTPVATASFQIPLILATFTNFNERARSYTSLLSLEDDFNSTDPVYVIASKLFGQSTVGAVPPSVVVGRRQVDSVTIVPSIVADATVYTVTINGIPYSFTSGVGATATTIAAGLDTAIGTPAGINATALTGVLTVGVSAPGTGWSISNSSNLTQTFVAPTETWVQALVAVEQENDVWYLLVSDVQTVADQEALSDAIQAREKIYGLSSADAVAPTTGITDIGYKLNAKSAGRTFGIYLPTAATEYPESAWAGSQLAVTPGSNDWDFKRAVGVTVSNLNATQIVNLTNKSWNFYRRKGGVNVFQNGNMFDQKPIDTQIGKDWLKARLQEAVYFRLINSLKIPLNIAA